MRLRAMLSPLSCVLLTVLCVWPAGSAMALAVTDPIAVTETDFGNFQHDPGTPTPVGTLGFGLNSISGSIPSALTLLGSGPDFFSVILPDGLLISPGMNLAVSQYEDLATPNHPSTVSLMGPSSGSESFDSDGTFIISPFTVSGSTIEFGIQPGVVTVNLGGIGGGTTTTNDAFAYTLFIDVQPISTPEPSTGLLVIAGLVGFGGWCRRSDG